MKLWAIFIFFLFAFLVVGTIFWSVATLISKVFSSIQESTHFSPLEDNIQVENTGECSDSDGGIFFNEKGRVDYYSNILFIKLRTSANDECKGDELIEYYCGGNNYLGKGAVKCENGCNEGRCD